MLDDTDRKVIAAMQDEFPLVAEPYKAIARKLGISEKELLERLARYKESGRIRKMGAVLRHRAVGYTANALCAWQAEPGRFDGLARVFTAHPAVTHCYARVAREAWPYSFYAMIHAHSREECRAIAGELAERAGIGGGVMLYSTREWKKTSMKYFREG